MKRRRRPEVDVGGSELSAAEGGTTSVRRTMTASTFPAEDERSQTEQAYVEEDLATGLARLRRRTGAMPTEKWLAIAGGVLMPLGVILVLIGWYGASHTTRLFEEIPYLISGGMLGMLLAILGAAFYFGYWLTRLVSGQRQMVELMARMEARIAGAVGAETNGHAGDSTAAAATPETLVATRTGTMFHRTDCPVVAGRSDKELRIITLPATGMSPCKLCAPLG